MSKSNFDKWNEKKKVAHYDDAHVPYFRVGEIWWAQLGKNIASESLGKGEDFLRPVLILQKLFGKSALVIPLTKQDKKGDYYFKFKDNKASIQTALLAQVRYVDGKRFKHQLSFVPKVVFNEIREKFCELIKK